MRLWILLISLSIAIVACTGEAPAEGDTPVPQDTSNNVEPTPDPNDAVAVVTLTPMPEGDALEVPLPQTLVASETEDPNAALVFDQLIFVRYGGPEGTEPINLILQQDGSYTLNDQPGATTPDRVIQLDDLLDEINFFGMQGTLLGPNTDTEDYRYRITVIRADDERTLQAQDGFYPQELGRIFGQLLAITAGR